MKYLMINKEIGSSFGLQNTLVFDRLMLHDKETVVDWDRDYKREDRKRIAFCFLF